MSSTSIRATASVLLLCGAGAALSVVLAALSLDSGESAAPAHRTLGATVVERDSSAGFSAPTQDPEAVTDAGPAARLPGVRLALRATAREPDLLLASTPRRKTSASERELRDAFLAREAAQPGFLARETRAIVDGDGPVSEKAAALRALAAQRSPLAWDELAHAVRRFGSDARESHASLAQFAVEELARNAADDASARTTLHELAFGADSAALSLRRRAAGALARVAEGAELDRLARACRRETDDLTRWGVVSVLELRADEHPADERELRDALAALWDPLRPRAEPAGARLASEGAPGSD